MFDAATKILSSCQKVNEVGHGGTCVK